VFGIGTSDDPVAIHRRLGYLPGEWNLYDRLTGAETITYFANLRGGVDRTYVDQLVQRLDLDPSRRFREYSRGNKQKVGLITALQHRPELLILDEPTSGLDPLVQQTFNELLFEAKADGRTVFLSSHIISEVERTCDRVAIIREGRIVRLDTVEGVRNLAAHEVELRFAAPVAGGPFEAIEGVRNLVEEGRTLRMLVTGPIAPVVRLAGQYDLVDFVSREPSLEEVFLSEYGTTSDAAPMGATR
jgi:ABC-2 type transport system ATP-binding protein